MTALDPTTWPAEDIHAILQRPERDFTHAAGASTGGMVIGGTVPLAQYAGRRALQAGGNAVDAAVVTATMQVVGAFGSYVSFAGIADLVIHDATTGEVTAISGPFKTFSGETDPMSIPANPTPSGRTAMVGGFFAALQAAHTRFGSLPWADLLAPAIWYADTGAPVPSMLVEILPTREKVLTRLPGGREVFAPDGDLLLRPGAMLRQPQLAATLRAVAAEGATYFYTGAWADRFVAAVQREAGKVTAEDLATYQPIIGPGIRGEAYGAELIGPNPPMSGGATLIEGLQLCERLGVGDPTTDGDALRWLVNVARQNHNLSQLPPARRLDPAQIDRVADAMRRADGPVGPSLVTAGSHSDYVATADAAGNIVAMCHSINCVMWGATGLFVDGISIPDAASFQQPGMAAVTPGEVLPHPMNPTLVRRDGRVVLASSSIGAGLVPVTLTHMHGVLGLGLSVADAAARPRVHHFDVVSGDSVTSTMRTTTGDGEDDEEGTSTGMYDTMVARAADAAEELIAEGGDPADMMARLFATAPTVIEDSFDPAVVAQAVAAGASLKPMPVHDRTLPRGFWVGLSRDPDTGVLHGARTPGAPGLIEVT